MSETYHVTLRRGEDGWHAVKCLEIPTAISQGRTKEEVPTNIRETVGLVLEELGSKPVSVEKAPVALLSPEEQYLKYLPTVSIAFRLKQVYDRMRRTWAAPESINRTSHSRIRLADQSRCPLA
jgi:predicted RNase H-like HicB family nuclease